MKLTTKRPIRWTKLGIEIPSGVTLDMQWDQQYPSRLSFKHESGKTLRCRVVTAHLNFEKFPKPPTDKTLEKWEWDGYCKTPTGLKTEPDGRAHDGSPSWLLAMEMI
jgi:hypothetical protein